MSTTYNTGSNGNSFQNQSFTRFHQPWIFCGGLPAVLWLHVGEYGLLYLSRDGGIRDDNTHFGVEVCGARVKMKGAYVSGCSIHDQAFGV